MTERVTVGTNGLEVGIGPDRIVERALRPLLHDPAELMITGVTEEDNLVFAARPGDWAGPSHGLKDLRGGIALAVIAEFGQ